ncbi:hypothetical protein DBV14_03900 [Variovorax sp. KBW07]|nr:hypothetical protein DBV14_03900 [Variovorax sp. KBW07]
MTDPQSSRTSCRFANPLAGGNTSGPAKPVPRYFWKGPTGSIRPGKRHARAGRAAVPSHRRSW